MRLVLFATALLLPLAAVAQTVPAPAPAIAAPARPSDAARKAALALNEKLQFVSQVKVILATVRGQIIVGLARSNNKTPEQVQPIVDELLMPDFTAHAGEFAGVVVDAWANAFTVEDLHGLVDFYSSPLGEKMLKTMPVLSQDVNKLAAGWVQAILNETTQKHAAALRDRGIKIPTEAAPHSAP